MNHRHAWKKAATGLFAVALLSTACSSSGAGGGQANDGPTSSAMSEPTAEDAPTGGQTGAGDDVEHEGAVTFAGPGGSLGDVYRGALTEFEEATGITVNYVEGRVADNFARIRAEQQSGQPEVDVFWSNDSVDPVGLAQGAFQSLDLDRIPNAEQLTDLALTENNIGILVQLGLSGLMYNTDIFEERGWDPPTSWTALTDSQYDCVVYTPPATGVGLRAQMMLNRIHGDGDPLDVEPAFAALEAARGSVAEIGGSTTEVVDAIASGRVCLGAVSEGRGLVAKADGAPVDFVIPDEGAPLSPIPLQLVTDAPNPVAGHMLIDWLLDVPAQERIYTEGYFTPTNLNVDRATEGVAADVALATDLDEIQTYSVTSDILEVSEDWTREFQSMDITN